MAEGAPDKDQQTEDPTQKKLDDALKKGDVAKSQDLVSWFMLGTATLIVATMASGSASSLAGPLAAILANADRIPFDAAGLRGLVFSTILAIVVAIGLPLAFLFLSGIAGNMVQHRFVLSGEQLKPKASKISPIAGFKRIFGKEAIVNFIKGLLKIAILGTAMVFVLWPRAPSIDALVRLEPSAILPFTLDLLVMILITVVAILLILAILDFAYQYQAWFKRQRMSFQEIKEEFKQTDGNPEIKAKLRQIRRERASRRMISNVPKATVVITNPTHFAVALKYESGMTAPTCLAKGADAVALRIREVARENDVPIVENPPLARALFAAIDVDDAIPEEQYKAVAEVIGYVLRLKGDLK